MTTQTAAEKYVAEVLAAVKLAKEQPKVTLTEDGQLVFVIGSAQKVASEPLTAVAEAVKATKDDPAWAGSYPYVRTRLYDIQYYARKAGGATGARRTKIARVLTATEALALAKTDLATAEEAKKDAQARINHFTGLAQAEAEKERNELIAAVAAAGEAHKALLAQLAALTPPPSPANPARMRAEVNRPIAVAA